MSVGLAVWEYYESSLKDKAAILEEEEISLRKSIFILLVGSTRHLSLNEVLTVLALRTADSPLDQKPLLLNPKKDIQRLGRPLVSIKDGSIQLIDIHMK